MDQPSSNSTEKVASEREIYILMMPVKEIGPFRRAFVRILKYTLGSTAALGWCMHWVILAENASFELQRYPTCPYTRLKASHWDGSSRTEVIQEIHIGRSSWTDKGIEDLGRSLEYVLE
jgi:hypothetical protein